MGTIHIRPTCKLNRSTLSSEKRCASCDPNIHSGMLTAVETEFTSVLIPGAARVPLGYILGVLRCHPRGRPAPDSAGDHSAGNPGALWGLGSMLRGADISWWLGARPWHLVGQSDLLSATSRCCN